MTIKYRYPLTTAISIWDKVIDYVSLQDLKQATCFEARVIHARASTSPAHTGLHTSRALPLWHELPRSLTRAVDDRVRIAHCNNREAKQGDVFEFGKIFVVVLLVLMR